MSQTMENATNCGEMSQTVGRCHKLQGISYEINRCGDVTNYGMMQQTVGRCHKNTGSHLKPWAGVTNHGQILQKYKKRCHKLWEGVTLWGDVTKIQRDITNCGEMSQITQRCHKLRGDVTNYREMSQTVGR